MIRLKELRKSKNINQQKLALKLNITQAAVSKYELGLSEPDISTLIKIADIFNVSIDYLIGLSDKPIQYYDSNISLKESALINNYRKLDDIQKAKVEAYIQGLLD